MTWNIVCDSSCDLTSTDHLPEGPALRVIPMTIRVGETEYTDDDALNVSSFVSHMSSEAGPTGTACPPPEAFAQAFATADCSVCFTISGSLSGTYQSACIGREMALEADPAKKIFVLDSKSTAGALILLVRKARSLIRSGRDFSAICLQLEKYQASLRTVFTLENFDNLVKNGRMRPLLGSLLQTLGIHVMAEGTRQGTIKVVGKARGENRTFKAMLDYLRENKNCDQAEVIISHCENPAAALRLKELIQKHLPVKSVTTLPCRGLNSFYAMEKGLIVVF